MAEIPVYIFHLLILCPWFVELTSPGNSEFYHMKSIKIIDPPETLRNNSYFGYSLTYVPKTKRLIASAPRATDIGKIYTCDIDKKTCTNVATNIKREYKNYEHDYWLGATVASGPDFYITCAPRYVKNSEAFSIKGEFATCYSSGENDTLVALTSLDSHEKEPFNFPEEEMDSFGWSITADKDSILIGGPAMKYGLAIRYSNKNSRPNIIKPAKMYNFGYSVAIINMAGGMIYAIGSTFGTHGEGSVTFLNKDLKTRTTLDKGQDRDMLGTMFGAALCAAKQKKARDALVVGAPAYAQDKEYNVGAVYVYVPGFMGLQFKRIIKGYQSGSFFGSAIVSTGDLNGDNYDEIAVAAPYEDDSRGAVYLYCGGMIRSKEGTISWLQRIQPEEFGVLSTFGLGLSALKDYDENGCNELAIGAPGVNKVAVLHCMAAVTIKMRAVFPNLQERKTKPTATMNETFASFDSCLDVIYPSKPKNIKAKIQVNVEVKHRSAKLDIKNADGFYSYFVSLDRTKTKYCEPIGLQLPKNGYYDMKIRYAITASLLESPVQDEIFDPSKVILTEKSIQSTSGYVWAAECKHANACEPKLSLKVKYGDEYKESYKYLIGSTNVVYISVIIKNEGEPSYSSCIMVRAEGVDIRRIPTTNCVAKPETDTVQCEPPMALHAGEEWNTQDFELDTTKLTNMDKEFVIHTELQENCGKPSESDKTYNVTFDLETESDGIIVIGTTQNHINNIVNVTQFELSMSQQIEHRYTFINNGTTNWKDVECSVQLKKSPYIIISDNTFYVQDGKCEVLPDKEEYWQAKCVINKIFKKKSENDIHVFIDLDSSTELTHALQAGNLTIQSNINVRLGEREIKESITSTVMLEEKRVPLWVIICGIIVGLLIMLLIAMILLEVGLLKRRNRRKLEELRKSVRRQTIRRSMMTEERRRIISQACEAVEEEDDKESEIEKKPTEQDLKRRHEQQIMEEIRKKNMNEKSE